jgi:hypothetical protein
VSKRQAKCTKVRRQATATRYSFGAHYTDPNLDLGEPSILETLCLFKCMLDELFAKGVKPGDRLLVVIQKQRTCRTKAKPAAR